MATVSDLRLANLRKLIEQWDGPTALATKLGYNNASFIVQMAGPSPTRPVSEKTARKFEEQLGLPEGWMDVATHQDTNVSQKVDVSLVTECIRLVGQTCQDLDIKLSPNKFADLVTIVYTDALESGGQPRLDHMRRLLSLLR